MNQYRAEKRLAWLYSLIVVLAAISSVCCAVAWTHWKAVLDLCADVNCGCILYARTTNINFEGGHVSSCLWVVFGPLPVIGVGLVMAGYHLIRVCINSVGKYEDENVTAVNQREGEVVMMSTRAEARRTDSISCCWLPAAVIGSFFTLYCIVHAAILTDGYYKSCFQYKAELIKSMRATGNQVTTIYSRLGCQPVFDFMDYLQPEYVFDRRRNDFINTGLALQMAIACSWLTVIVWIAIVVINSIRAYKDRHVSTCCGM